MKKKITAFFIIIFGLILIVCMDGLVNKKNEETDVHSIIDSKGKYASYDIPYETELSQKILYEDDDITCYVDRIVKKISVNQARIVAVQNIAGRLASSYGKTVIVVPIPGRYIIETDQEEQQIIYDEFFSSLQDGFADNGILVDLREKYTQHKGEFLYYKTDDNITALGGVYGADTVVEAIGGTALNEKKYLFQACNSFHGKTHGEILKKFSDNTDLVKDLKEMPQEKSISCLYDGINLNEIVYKTDANIFERPTIITSLSDDNTIVGYNFKQVKIEGVGLKYPDEEVILVCDANGKNLAPYLAYYYKNVHVVMAKDRDTAKILLNSMKENDECSTIIWAQKASEIGDRTYTAGLNYLLE